MVNLWLMVDVGLGVLPRFPVKLIFSYCCEETTLRKIIWIGCMKIKPSFQHLSARGPGTKKEVIWDRKFNVKKY